MRRPVEITILIVFVGLAHLWTSPATAQSIDAKYQNVGDFDPPGGRFSLQNDFWPTMWSVKETHPSLTPPQESPPIEEPNTIGETDYKTPEPAKKEQTSKSANDPDNSQHMQIQWEMWHRRVAEAISLRFNGIAQRAFAQSRPIACQAAYTVTRNKQIVNVRLLHKSNNIVYNSMVLMVLKSMNGNSVLEFPSGSKRESAEKTGEFDFHGSVTKDGTICDPPMQQQIMNTPTNNR
jgi:hypothetical protein